MFLDWLSVYQDFDISLPNIGKHFDITIDAETGEQLVVRQPLVKQEGSYSTVITIRISGNRIYVKGNPSRYNRIDNLFGFASVDQCISVYNQVLLSLGLPPFTKCTKRILKTGSTNGRFNYISNGAVITEIHITTNKTVGRDNVKDYLKGIAGQRYRNSIPNLKPNGCTVEWLTEEGNAPLIYASIYDKAHQIGLHHLGKIKRKFGEDSSEYQYLLKVHQYCLIHGVVRAEQKLKARYLNRENLQFWGLSDYSRLELLQDKFLSLDSKLKVTAMDIETLTETLIREQVCTNTKSANSTALYAIEWMHGKSFDFNKSQVKTHRARLRRIGIDIKQPCDLSKFSPIKVVSAREVTVSTLQIPDWYIKPAITPLRLVS